MKIYSLLIHHRHGDDVTLHKTDVDANLAVEEFVQRWWPTEMGDEPIPEDPGQALSVYFNDGRVEGEWFQVDEHDFEI